MADADPTLDHEALHAKYLAERDKRLRQADRSKYFALEGSLAERFDKDIWAPDDGTREPVARDFEAVVVGGGFGGMIEKLVSEAATTMRGAETASVKQVAGKGDLIDVVTAVGAAETALDTVVAVRDRMVNAYSEIMRMQI